MHANICCHKLIPCYTLSKNMICNTLGFLLNLGIWYRRVTQHWLIVSKIYTVPSNGIPNTISLYHIHQRYSHHCFIDMKSDSKDLDSMLTFFFNISLDRHSIQVHQGSGHWLTSNHIRCMNGINFRSNDEANTMRLWNISGLILFMGMPKFTHSLVFSSLLNPP